MSNTRKKALIDRRFECQNCGTCCSEMAIIYPSREEVQQLAEFLNISELSFAIRYLREIFDPQMNVYIIAFKANHPESNNNGCIFCHNKLCAIYNSPRTDLCNVFPWNHFDIKMEKWEENFLTKNGGSWCPGIGIGREWTLDEIRNIKQKYPNVGIKIKRQSNQPPQQFLDNERVSSSFTLNLTMLEDSIVNKFRSLSMEKRKEIERLIDSLYHI